MEIHDGNQGATNRTACFRRLSLYQSDAGTITHVRCFVVHFGAEVRAATPSSVGVNAAAARASAECSGGLRGRVNSLGGIVGKEGKPFTTVIRQPVSS